MNRLLVPLESAGWLPDPAQLLAQTQPLETFVDQISNQLGGFLPRLISAILLLIIGWLVATIAATGIRKLLSKTDIDNRLATWVTDGRSDKAVANWTSITVYWVILIFTLVAVLNTLNLAVVSEPLNNFLQQIFLYLPRVGGAAVLLVVAWVVATIVKLVVTRGLSRFNLDSRLAEQTGATEGGTSPFLVNETLGNVLYWFIFLLFLPLVLSALDLPGLVQPVEGLINQFLSAIPRIITALIILGLGWLVAKIVRGIVTNLLLAAGTDRIGTRLGLASETGQGITLSSLAGTVVYVLILIPAAVAALNELNIDAISDPAVVMLQRVLAAIPQVLTAAVVLVIFYVVARFVSDLVVSLLTSMGFDRVLSILGLPELSPPAPEPPVDPAAPEGMPATMIQPPTPASGRRPSEVVGLIVLVGIVLFGAVAATEVLQFPALSDIVREMLAVSAQVLSGVVVFAVGLYFAQLAFRLVSAMGTGQARTLAQAARISILILVGAMALQQMGVATNIVNLAFGLLAGAIAVAVAIAFGLGGRDVASEQLREWLQAFKRQ